MRSRKIRVGAVAAMAVTGLVLAGCASDDDTNEPQSAGGTWPGEGMSECEGLEQLAEFGDLTGTTVGVYTSILPPEQEAHEASYELFTTCTGAEVDYDGSDQFETPPARSRPPRRPPPTTSTSSSVRTGRATAPSTAPSTPPRSAPR